MNENDERLVKKDDYDNAVKQGLTLGERVRKLEGQEKRANRIMDGARRITQVAVVVILFMLGFALFFEHPVTDGPHKRPAIAMLAVICVGYGVCLQFSGGHFSIILFLLLAGATVTAFSAGVVITLLTFQHLPTASPVSYTTQQQQQQSFVILPRVLPARNGT